MQLTLLKYTVIIILLLLIISHFLLIYELYHTYVWYRRKHSTQKVQYYVHFEASTGGSWNVSPAENGGGTAVVAMRECAETVFNQQDLRVSLPQSGSLDAKSTTWRPHVGGLYPVRQVTTYKALIQYTSASFLTQKACTRNQRTASIYVQGLFF